MNSTIPPLDQEGKSLTIGDLVLFTVAPESLLSGLLAEDREAIQVCVGKELTIAGFDDFGYAELEFTYEDSYHTIWVEPFHLRKIA